MSIRYVPRRGGEVRRCRRGSQWLAEVPELNTARGGAVGRTVASVGGSEGGVRRPVRALGPFGNRHGVDSGECLLVKSKFCFDGTCFGEL